MHAPAVTSKPWQFLQFVSAACAAHSLPNPQEPFFLPTAKSASPQLHLPPCTHVLPCSTNSMLTALSTGSSQAKPSGTAKAIPQDEILQLLHTAVYSAAEDQQRQSSIQQLARMVPRLQQPPGPANDIATFSTRWMRHLLMCCWQCTSLAWHWGCLFSCRRCFSSDYALLLVLCVAHRCC